jgi:hypothetical protein
VSTQELDFLTVEDLLDIAAAVLDQVAARVLHLLNGRDLTYTVADAERLMLQAASGELDVNDIAARLEEHGSAAS